MSTIQTQNSFDIDTFPPNMANPNAAAFFNAAGMLLQNLFFRWQDEKQYEDIADYREPLEKLANAHSCTVHHMTKRPFGCVFKTGGRWYSMTTNSRGQQAYSRIG